MDFPEPEPRIEDPTATAALKKVKEAACACKDAACAEKAADDDDYLETGYTAVDTNFALGFLLQATGARLSRKMLVQPSQPCQPSEMRRNELASNDTR